jgi:hypothetical protein
LHCTFRDHGSFGEYGLTTLQCIRLRTQRTLDTISMIRRPEDPVMSSRRRDAAYDVIVAQNDTIPVNVLFCIYDTILAAVQIALFRCLICGNLNALHNVALPDRVIVSGLRCEFIERIYIGFSIAVTDGNRPNLSIPTMSLPSLLFFSNNFAYFAWQLEAGCLCFRCPCP